MKSTAAFSAAWMRGRAGFAGGHEHVSGRTVDRMQPRTLHAGGRHQLILRTAGLRARCV